MAAFLFNLDGDAENYREALKLNPGCLPEAQNWLREQADERGLEFLGYEEVWTRELEYVWPVIRQLADRLMTGPLTGQAATELVRALWEAEGGA